MTNTVSTTIFPRLSEAIRLREKGDNQRATQLLLAHLRERPDEPRGLAQLGFIAVQSGALGQAEHFLRRALARGENSLELRRTLASVYSQQERLHVAEAFTSRLISDEGDRQLRGLRANLLDRMGRHEEALAIQHDLVGENPQSIGAWIAYGHSLRAAGRVEDAMAAYRTAIAIDDGFGEAWWGLASIKRKVLTDGDIAAMEQALAIAVDERNIAPLHFALGRAFHDRGQFDKAFHHYEAGNRIRAESIGYDATELTGEVAEIEQLADRAFMERMSPVPNGTDQPVFIICLPRSGSTLLEQMLGSHPAIEPVGELPYIPAILRSFMEISTRRGPVSVPQAIASLSDEQAAMLGQDYLARARLHRKTDRPFFIDKLPQNWSNVLFIRRILPQARFIDIRRPAMDCCFSNFSLSFTTAHAASFALRDVGQTYVDYVRLMAHFDQVAPGMIHHVSYRALVDDQEATLRPALEYLGLEWDEAIRDFHTLDRVVRTPSSEQVRRPINRDGMEIWRPYAQWLDPLREVLGELADS
ncbi:sulfotransferase [Altererythrobacter sp. H2]|uniref:tetratricopeptide repeat-containing sulfotransferase family protein n=1 Tax=Altererythrobacter sp. H2 TaxID=3108391 RepID=UPI002B4BB702|nr:sulfotransferase [Altererythrobacter sp. H2]WRK95404.1 sulfotransferase [Altererythrobacter sp. H2]